MVFKTVFKAMFKSVFIVPKHDLKQAATVIPPSCSLV